jgi:uncharacterized cupredoxin-like copper-binding protein
MKWLLASGLTLIALSTSGASLAGPADEAASATVTFRMVEWDILPLTATKTKAAKVTFVVRNAGKLTHEFVVVKTATPAGSLAGPSEKEASEKGAVDEIEQIKPGQVKRLTITLAKAHYSLLCNLPGHYRAGQFVDFYVR